jgi:histidyl-tRNA synthetase
MENLSTLLGKYGEEGDKLLFRILNSGNFLTGVNSQVMPDSDYGALSAMICEKGLRYDLTVPFARYVVQHREEITFPFKRYQIQPVWRADRPQKGRYREFYQCDVDVIGSDSLLNENELILIIREIFTKLGVRSEIRLNNRKILAGIAEIAGVAGRITDITVEIDKLDKIGAEAVKTSLLAKGIPAAAVTRIQPILDLSGTFTQKLDHLEAIFSASEVGMKGVTEMRELFSFLSEVSAEGIILDLTLARGLNYYTGTIIEVKALDAEIGSICGGGRYDNLTGIFGLENVSGVGVSFGADRIYDVMLHAGLFPLFSETGTVAMLVNFGGEELRFCLDLASKLRNLGVNTELYPEAAKMKKQFSYADSKKIPLVIIAGSDEISKGVVTLKNMTDGTQTTITVKELLKKYE